MTISRMQEPRQLYGLGSLVKSIAKGVKGAVKGVAKAAKSPLGKAAILGIGAFGLPGGAFGMRGLLPQTSALRSIPTNLLFGRERGVIPGERTGGITSALKGMFTQPSTFKSKVSFRFNSSSSWAIRLIEKKRKSILDSFDILREVVKIFDSSISKITSLFWGRLRQSFNGSA